MEAWLFSPLPLLLTDPAGAVAIATIASIMLGHCWQREIHLCGGGRPKQWAAAGQRLFKRIGLVRAPPLRQRKLSNKQGGRHTRF